MDARLIRGSLLMAHCESVDFRAVTPPLALLLRLTAVSASADNFLFDHRGHLYLTDLGLCKAVEEDEISEVTAHALKEGAAPEGGLSPPTDSHHERPPAAYVRDRKLAYSTVGSESGGALHAAGVPAGVRALRIDRLGPNIHCNLPGTLAVALCSPRLHRVRGAAEEGVRQGGGLLVPRHRAL